jgi:two-component system response regulator AlgR
MDGMEVARHLAGQESRPAVVFCTAYDDRALEAFEAAAIDYLVKPVRRERLTQAIDKASRVGPSSLPSDGGEPRSHLCARLRGSLRLIPVPDIRYLQAEEKYVVVHHARGEDLIEDSLKTLETEFGERFLRIHRGCLIARDQLSELRRSPDGQVHVVLRDGGEVLEVSRRCAPGLREKIQH